MFSTVRASGVEVATPRAGDSLVAPADVVMDRAFTVDGTPEIVWPWLAQLGKQRAGWYLPATIERVLPRSRRAARAIDPVWLRLTVGDVIPDYGGREASFEVAEINEPTHLVYRSRRGRTEISWSITLEPVIGTGSPSRSRVFLRLRMAPVRREWLARTVGELVDLLTVAGMAAGLRERLAEQRASR